MAKKRTQRKRDYAAEYKRRIERGLERGFSRSVARGHPRKSDEWQEMGAQQRRKIGRILRDYRGGNLQRWRVREIVLELQGDAGYHPAELIAWLREKKGSYSTKDFIQWLRDNGEGYNAAEFIELAKGNGFASSEAFTLWLSP